MARTSLSGTPEVCVHHTFTSSLFPRTVLPASRSPPDVGRLGSWSLWHRRQWGRGCKSRCGCMFCSALSASPPSLPACPRHTVGSTACSSIQDLRVARDSRLCGSVARSCHLGKEGLPEGRRGGGGGGGCACVHLTCPLPLITKILPRRSLFYHPTPVYYPTAVRPQHSRVSSLFCPFPTPHHSSAVLSFRAVFPTALFWGHGGRAYSSGGFRPAFGACALDRGLSSASLPRLKTIPQ